MSERKWTDEQLEEAVKVSFSFKEVIDRLGLLRYSEKIIAQHIAKLYLDISHFTKVRTWTDEEIIEAVKDNADFDRAIKQLGIGAKKMRKRMKALGLHFGKKVNKVALLCNSASLSKIGTAKSKGHYTCPLMRCAKTTPHALLCKDCINYRSEKNAKQIRRPITRYNNLTHSSKTRGLECALTYEEYQQLVIDKPCNYCKDAFNTPSVAGSGLDRLDNLKGYILGNVVPCCTTCNRIRGNVLTPEETRIAVKAVIAYRRSLVPQD